MADSTFITRVRLKNYRSIASCDVKMGPLTFLVGPNGSGKSNFLDALRFVSDGLNTTLEHAQLSRGGIDQIAHQSGNGHPTSPIVELEVKLPDGYEGHYSIKIGAQIVFAEELFLRRPDSPDIFYSRDGFGVKKTTAKSSPANLSDRFYLVSLSGQPEFRPIYDALSRMSFYNVNPDKIREPQAPSATELLARDGANLASVLRRLDRHNPATKKRIEEYLSKIVPDIAKIEVKPLGTNEFIGFQQLMPDHPPWWFTAINMSDGTLRALGNLVALFQFNNGGSGRPSLIAIEEPETALHPAASGVLLDALREAGDTTQVLVTSHSPDLLDDKSIPEEQILAVATEDGATRIGRVNDAGRSVLRDRLFTPGEMLRMDQLQPAPEQEQAETEHA